MRQKALPAFTIIEAAGLISITHARSTWPIRNYRDRAILQAQAERPGSVRRIPATEIENLVIQTVRDHIKPLEAVDDRSLVEAHVERVEIRPDRLIVKLNQTEAVNGSQPEGTNTLHGHQAHLYRQGSLRAPRSVPWRMRKSAQALAMWPPRGDRSVRRPSALWPTINANSSELDRQEGVATEFPKS